MKVLRGLFDRLAYQGSIDGKHSSVRSFASLNAMARTLHAQEAEDYNHNSKSSGRQNITAIIEWKLPIVDEKSTEPQTMEEEVKRLEVLQSYLVLDSEAEEEFDRITHLAINMFNVPIALVSLIDLGRQWFLSKVGLDETETPRKHSFCAHVILNRHNILVIPDATRDFRFKDNPLVIGHPRIRFYAGAALVSPEGYKLGTLCIISDTPRPQGFSFKEEEMLHDMAGIVVSALVARRNRLIRAEYDIKGQELARALIKSSNSIRATKEALSSYISRRNTASDPSRNSEALLGALKNLDVYASMCSAVSRTLTEKDKTLSPNINDSFSKGDVRSAVSKCAAENLENILCPWTDTRKVFENLKSITRKYPHPTTVTVELDENAPCLVPCEDLLLFRSALNLLTFGISRSSTGSVHLRIRASEDDLMVECEDSGPILSNDQVQEAFERGDSFLAPVATMIRAMNGTYGMDCGRLDEEEDGSPLAIFWFRVSADETKDVVGSTMSEIFAPNNDTSTLSVCDHLGKFDPFNMTCLGSGFHG